MPSTVERRTSQIVKRGRRMEKTVIAAAQQLRGRAAPEVDRVAVAAVEMAGFIRVAIEELAADNQQLRGAMDRLTNSLNDHDEDDTRFFGTHLREAWHALIGR